MITTDSSGGSSGHPQTLDLLLYCSKLYCTVMNCIILYRPRGSRSQSRVHGKNINRRRRERPKSERSRRIDDVPTDEEVHAWPDDQPIIGTMKNEFSFHLATISNFHSGTNKGCFGPDS